MDNRARKLQTQSDPSNAGTKHAYERNHINEIENFWTQAKRHFRRYNGVPKAHFTLFLKECERRYNYRPAANLLSTLRSWVKV